MFMLSVVLLTVLLFGVMLCSAVAFCSAVAPDYKPRRSRLNYALFGLSLLLALATVSFAKATQPFTFVDPSPDPVVVQPPPIVVQPAPVIVQPASVFFTAPAVGYGSYGYGNSFGGRAFFGPRIGGGFRFNSFGVGNRFFNPRINNRAFFNGRGVGNRVNVRVNFGRRFIR